MKESYKAYEESSKACEENGKACKENSKACEESGKAPCWKYLKAFLLEKVFWKKIFAFLKIVY